MKKIIILFLILSSVQFSFGQKKTKFKAGAKIIDISIVDNYTPPKSIVFIFKGDTHLVNYYLDLQKKIENKFKNSSIKIDFKYSLSSKKPFRVDLENIPNFFNKIENYKTIGNISISFVSDPSGRQNYNLTLKLTNVKTGSILLQTVINVNTYNTILTENIKTSDLIHKIVTIKN